MMMTAKEEGKEPMAKEIAIEPLLRAQKEGLPQTRDAFYHNNNNGERSYSALGAIHHYLFNHDESLYEQLFKDGNRRPLSYTIEMVKSVLGKELCQHITTLNDSGYDSESTRGYSFGEIAEKIMNEYH